MVWINAETYPPAHTELLLSLLTVHSSRYKIWFQYFISQGVHSGLPPLRGPNKYIYSSLPNYLVTLLSISQRSPFTLFSTESIESMYCEECEHFCRSA